MITMASNDPPDAEGQEESTLATTGAASQVTLQILVALERSSARAFERSSARRSFSGDSSDFRNGVSEIAAPHRRRAPAFRTFVLQLRITAI